jgi:choice-of-anchor B domain-containing protein
MRTCAIGLVCAVGIVAGHAAAFTTTSTTHPGGEEERLLGKGDSTDVRFGNFPAQDITFLSQVPISAFGLGADDANDCWGYVTPQGKEIAILGLQTGTGFVDITDPANPQILAAYSGPSSLWRDIKVIGTIAYVVTEGGNHIQKFDLSDADNGNIGNLGYSSYSGVGSTHNIIANPDSGYIYRAGGANNMGLRAYGVGVNGAPGTPTNPSQQSVQSDLYVHDAQVVNYTTGPYAGREIAFLCSGYGNGSSDTRLRIWDVTDKSNMFELSSIYHPVRRYIHQGWLSEDRKYFYVNDELDEGRTLVTTLHIYNVEDLENPYYVKGWTNGSTARDHNLYVKGHYIYASNYRSGLRIFDIQDPENPVEVAWMDTYPADDGLGYDGSWSNYPFFPSGNVIISDIQQGLIVVRPELDTLSFTIEQALGETFSPAGGDELVVSITERNVTLDPSTPTLNLRDSQGAITQIAGTPTGAPNTYSFTTPRRGCLETIDWWVSAQSNSGQTYTWPQLAPTQTNSSVVATSLVTAFEDDAETDPGYTVTGTATDGQWTRGVPVNGGRGDPASDADGSGRAWLTDNVAGNSDVDNGETILTSPVIDASAGGNLTYSYWLNDTSTGSLGTDDQLRVEYATNAAGTNWATLRTYEDAFNQWRDESVVIGDAGEIPATGTLRLRFIAADVNSGNIVEAGIDAIRIEKFECVEPPACAADTNGDGLLSPADFSAWVAAFNAQATECDQNADGSCTPADFSAWVANYNAGC